MKTENRKNALHSGKKSSEAIMAKTESGNDLRQIIIIKASQTAKRLDSALADGDLSRSRIQQLIKSGMVAYKGKSIIDSDHKVREGEEYVVTIPPPEPALPKAQSMPLNIVYEDDDLLVIDKAAGMVVHPAAGNRDHTMVNALLAHCGDSLSGIGGVARPGIVHRLDKDTSGLMVVAKHDAAHQGLSSQFADRSLSRVYNALVWGAPTPIAGQIEGAIGRHPRDRKKMAVVAHGGKLAITNYRLIKSYDSGCSLVECILATGRTHQIRVHMAHIKHPLVGDPVYGKKGSKIAVGANACTSFSRQALHAAELKFIHPITGKPMKFKADLPDDMRSLLKSLRRKKLP